LSSNFFFLKKKTT